MSNIACQIVQVTQRLREEDPNRYRTKGSKGNPGYVPGGWSEAVRAATQMYYQTSGKTPSQATIKRRQLDTIPQQLKGHPELDALYRGYKRQLEDLKTRYWEPGLHIKAVQPQQQRAPRAPGQKSTGILPLGLFSVCRNKVGRAHCSKA